jgi:hypothetical protein
VQTHLVGEFIDEATADGIAELNAAELVEGLPVAPEFGGELGRLLRNLSGYLRHGARTRSEMESRQAWTLNGAPHFSPLMVSAIASTNFPGRSAHVG